MAEYKTAADYRSYLITNGLNPDIAAAVADKMSYPIRVQNSGTPTTDATEHYPIPTLTKLFPAPSDITTETQSNLKRPRTKKPAQQQLDTYDFRDARAMPAWVKEVIETRLAIDAEDVKAAGALGFMARAFVNAAMPYRDQKNLDGTPKDAFTRTNGNFSLRIVAGYKGGIPYGIYPRLLLGWVTTEAVRRQSPDIELGTSLAVFLREVMDLRATGGSSGTMTRMAEQMRRTFGSLITAEFAGSADRRGFQLRNVLIADALKLDEADLLKITERVMSLPDIDNDTGSALWTPQTLDDAGRWQSKVRLTEGFFSEIVNNPVPIDLRAYKSLRGSPLAMDVYTWLTYRMSYTKRATRPIPWEALMAQFGANYGVGATDESVFKQAVRDFKRDLLKALKVVQLVYPEAQLRVVDNGLVLLPSNPHVPKIAGQQKLF